MRFAASIQVVLGSLISLAVYLAGGAIAHHVLVGPRFDPYLMMSWGVVLGWPFVLMYAIVVGAMALGGVIIALVGASEKEWAMSGVGVAMSIAGVFLWRLFF